MRHRSPATAPGRRDGIQLRRAWSCTGLTLAAALAGGSLFGACQTRIRDAFVQGAKDVLFTTFFDADAILGSLDGTTP